METMNMEEQRQVSTEKTAGGQVTTEKTTSSPVSEADKGAFQMYYLVYYLLGVLEVILAVRLALKLLGANPDSGFVSFMYAITGAFVAPFAGIFPVATTTGVTTVAVLEPAVVIAMIVYALVGWGVAKLIAVMMAGRE